jgi:hypothetical protein
MLIRTSLFVLAATVLAVPAVATGTGTGDAFDVEGDDIDGDDDGSDDSVGPRRGRLAQRGPGRGGAAGVSDEERAAKRAGMRERVQQKIQSYLTVELATRAGLDEKKSVALGGALKAHMERRKAAHQAQKAELEKLKGLMNGGNDAAIKGQLGVLAEKRQAGQNLKPLLDDTARFLTPTEQAKVLVALPEVMKDAKKLVREARAERRRGRQ